MGVRSTGSYPTTTSADGHLLRYYREDMGVGGGARGLFSSSGGTVFTIGNYKYHVFASGADNFTASNIEGISVDVLAVGGGGAGSPSMGAGGGGGGLVYHESADGGVFNGTTVITVGGGGTKIPADPASGLPGNNGTDTTIGSLYTAMGGGGGSRYSPSVSPTGSPVPFPTPSVVTTPSPFNRFSGNRGGSGGGAGGSSATAQDGGASLQTTYTPLPANSRLYGFGFPGGDNSTYASDNYYSRCGGGGAGSAGGNNTTPLGSGIESWGWGGDGKNLPASFMDPGFPAPVIAALGGVPTSSPEWAYFAGGGGAGSNGGPATVGADSNGKNRGGLGNNTGPSSTYEYGYGSHTGNGVNGCPGRGGGGGGGRWSTGEGGSGGGGCVIIRILQ